ncbi:MAG: universal stress protein [Chloroflexi bacterium]|nr:universal stress protein [Chloroflexota bacterium]
MYRSLLVPLDGSRLAEAVLPVVAGLARTLAARLTLLHIIERGAPAMVHGERHLRDVTEASRYLEGVAGGLAALGVPASIHCHEAAVADVALSIAAHVAEIGADLVAICTHGSGGLRATLSGTIAQQVLRLGTTPVLVVRPAPDSQSRPFAPRLVLTPLDGSPQGERALDVAAGLAGRFGAAVRLVRVVPTQATVRGDPAATARLLPAATTAMLDLVTAEAHRYLAEWAERLTATGLAVAGEVRRGDIVDELVAAAASADLVVMSTHGRVGLGALWSGSVTALVLGRLTCPVILLRLPAS